jgi:drug/metabolite transporter (DMT)-like permease
MPGSTPRSRRASHTADLLGPGSAVVTLGLVAALAWGAGDFGGGLLARRAPVVGIVILTQLTGFVAALGFAAARGEPLPVGEDVAWSILAGVAGVVGITALYHGLAVGRMGVVAPTTGLLAALIPVVAGFALQGVPDQLVIGGIAVALVAVVLVTRSPDAGSGRPSGVGWALIAGAGFGLFNVSIGQLSGEGAFGPLALIRLVQAAALGGFIVTRRQRWRLPRDVVPRAIVVGLFDMGGNAAFILATQAGALAIAAVLSSLYPVVTVILAIAILRERVTRSHVIGIVLTAVAIVLIGVGANLG